MVIGFFSFYGFKGFLLIREQAPGYLNIFFMEINQFKINFICKSIYSDKKYELYEIVIKEKNNFRVAFKAT